MRDQIRVMREDAHGVALQAAAAAGNSGGLKYVLAIAWAHGVLHSEGGWLRDLSDGIERTQIELHCDIARG